MASVGRSESSTRNSRPPSIVGAAALAALAAVHSSPAWPEDVRIQEARVSEAKIALHAQDGAGDPTPSAVCSVRMVEGSREVALLCRHGLGTNGEVTLVRAGIDARSELPYWSAPLSNPFEAVAELDDEAMSLLQAGELAIRIETGTAGVAVEGTVGTPIYIDGFDTFSMCRWSNFPCPGDGNACTDEACSSTGVCSHPNDNTNTCALPHGTGGCFNGNCAVVISCFEGYDHCDFDQANGCEVNHNAVSGSCGSPTLVGAHGGDAFCGAGCGPAGSQSFATRTGLGEAWFSAQAQENSSCTASLSHEITLSVPGGIDWDLYVYDGCDNLIDSSEEPVGVDEHVGIATAIDNLGSDDSFFYRIEVRYFSGFSCQEWSLTFSGTACN